MQRPPEGFEPHDFLAPYDQEEILRTLRPALAKGFVMQGLINEAKAQGKPFPNAPSYIAFKDYPFRESVVLSYRMAQHLYPHLPIREAVRRLGHRGYGSVLESTVGRAMFGVLNLRMESLIKLIPRAYGIAQKGGEVKVVWSTPESALISFRDFPVTPDTFQIGLFEGGFMARKKKHEVYLKTLGFGEGDVFCTWEE
jgi:uncharacterized protein (TIGR02265 family)